MSASNGGTSTVVPIAAWRPILFGALAGGMGWGIRGQYGHETGAMLAGLLVSLTLVLLCCPQLNGREAMRAVAWGTVAIGFGGSMTYGQTVGLTHDRELVGNTQALLWGMLGLSIKGGLWIGFSGVFLGMGLGGKRYRSLEIACLMLGILGLCWTGLQLLNEPFDPARKILPQIYFSDDWRWEPGAVLKPRREVWGGMLFALAGLMGYVRFHRGDRLAFRLGLWAVVGGMIGFPLGQCLQAYHAWHPELFHQGVWLTWDPVINWWNFMETTFGTVMGAALGCGLWLNRSRVQSAPAEGEVSMSSCVGWGLLALHCVLLTLVEFYSVGWVDRLYDFGLYLGLLPVVCVAGDRRWPYWIPAITVFPVAGKTVREMVYDNHTVSPGLGWILYLVIPCAVSVALAWWLQRERRPEAPARVSLAPMLLLYAWTFFLLNYAFFRFPWPWVTWTARTPNALIYTACVLGLTWVGWRHSSRLRRR